MVRKPKKGWRGEGEGERESLYRKRRQMEFWEASLNSAEKHGGVGGEFYTIDTRTKGLFFFNRSFCL